jgi:hypothetical protein
LPPIRPTGAAKSPFASGKIASISASAGEFLGYIAHYADGHGIETIESLESREKCAAIELEREMGFAVAADPDDPTLVGGQRKLGANWRAKTSPFSTAGEPATRSWRPAAAGKWLHP